MIRTSLFSHFQLMSEAERTRNYTTTRATAEANMTSEADMEAEAEAGVNIPTSHHVTTMDNIH